MSWSQPSNRSGSPSPAAIDPASVPTDDDISMVIRALRGPGTERMIRGQAGARIRVPTLNFVISVRFARDAAE